MWEFGFPVSLDLLMIGRWGGGEGPFDPSRKEASCWFGGQSDVESIEEWDFFSVNSLYKSLDPSCAGLFPWSII